MQELFGRHDEEQLHPVEFNHPGVQLEKKERAGELFNPKVGREISTPNDSEGRVSSRY